ncbi:bile acid:sodium symporter family protein [Bergeyella sp. RCAD1439]|uniref:bile acid:sodium symporter family protein n=1 Tax=Bergeyella anatis TaxID=3113737 RepID=UPI002E1989B3|nr:bile acid:sodium symporter family protein [Bergeyella sp. RCAD1439]
MNSKLAFFDRQTVFLLLLGAMVAMAKGFPYKAHYSVWFDLPGFIDWGIAGIFLLYGLKLDFRSVGRDLSNWRLHLLVQFGTFVLFPVLVLLFYGLVRGGAYELLWLACFFLACLPSTVSSSVVMVSMARGNVTSAIFNASVSGWIGVVVTPLLMGLFLTSSGVTESDGAVFRQLLLKVILPIGLGGLLNPLFRKTVSRYGKVISEFDRLVILLIVYESFSKAFTERVFAEIPLVQLAGLSGFVIGLFFVVYEVLRRLAVTMGFGREDTITATFCGSKKSLVHGSLFVMVLGISPEQKVIFLLPVMIYHSFQLFYVSWLANRLARETS